MYSTSKISDCASSVSQTKQLVDQLIRKNHEEYDLLYRAHWSSHLVHGICTLYQLGASTERIQNFYNSYSKRLKPLQEPRFLVTDENWENYIGDPTAYPELILYFRQQLNLLGIEKSLDKFLPRLFLGLAGGAFHPLIHLGFGIKFQYPIVVAEGLAHACTYPNSLGEVIDQLPEGETGSESQSWTALEIIRKLQSLQLKPPIRDRSICLPLHKILDDYESEVIDLAQKWTFTSDAPSEAEIEEKLNDLTEATILVFFGSFLPKRKLDFFLAHNLTGLHGARILLKSLKTTHDKKRLLQILLVGLIADYWFQGNPPFEKSVIMEYSPFIPDWEPVIQKAIHCEDEHTMKVVNSLVVIRDGSKDQISDELLIRAANMMVNTVHIASDWEFEGIGKNC